MSTQKWFILALLIASGFGYLEWGQDQRAFFFEMEWTVFEKLLSNPSSVIHPLIILPLLGQSFLLWALFKSSNSNWVLKSGIYLLLPLFLLVFCAFKLQWYYLACLLSACQLCYCVHFAKKNKGAAA
jgi:hypothetical protein